MGVMPLSPDSSSASGSAAPLLRIENLAVAYKIGLRRSLRAVSGVSLEVARGSTLALIGESGSGKSTIARAVCGLGPIERGVVSIAGTDIAQRKDRAAAAGSLGVQIVFQDPISALNPRWPIWRSIAEPRLRLFPPAPDGHRALAVELLERVGLDRSMADRVPSQLSGGQRQRVTIARALSPEPKLIILDEAVSALDVSVRNEILALLDELKRERGLTYLLISHDMGAVIQIASEVAVLYLGKLVEVGRAVEVIGRPLHPYTRALIRAVPVLNAVASEPARRLSGEIGDPANPPPGCRFHPRCRFAIPRCSEEEPFLRELNDRQVACHRADEIAKQEIDAPA
ncbi:MAG: ABC transporter ATP-binding protein [Xanthobacteraceae bacterium]